MRGLPTLQGSCQGEEGEVEGDKIRSQSGGVEREALEAEEDKELQKQDKQQKGVQDDFGCGSWCEVQREGLDEKEGDSEFVHDEE